MATMSEDAIRRAAALIAAARLGGHRFGGLPADCRPPDEAAAYRVQDRSARPSERRRPGRARRPQDRLHHGGHATVPRHRQSLRRRRLRPDRPAPRGQARACGVPACGRRVRDRGASRPAPAGRGRALRPGGRRGCGRRLHGGDRGRRRPLRGLPVARHSDLDRRRFFQCGLRVGRPG